MIRTHVLTCQKVSRLPTGPPGRPVPVDLYSAICDDHKCIHIYTVACTLNSRLLSGHFEVVAGTLRGSLFSVRYGLVGVQLARLRALCQGTVTAQCVKKDPNATVLVVTGTMQ